MTYVCKEWANRPAGRAFRHAAGRLLLAGWALAASAFAFGAERSIDRETIVAAPIDTVWAAWTSKAGIESFFAPEAEIEAKVGGAFHIQRRFETGPYDWTARMAGLRKAHAAAAASAPKQRLGVGRGRPAQASSRSSA